MNLLPSPTDYRTNPGHAATCCQVDLWFFHWPKSNCRDILVEWKQKPWSFEDRMDGDDKVLYLMIQQRRWSEPSPRRPTWATDQGTTCQPSLKWHCLISTASYFTLIVLQVYLWISFTHLSCFETCTNSGGFSEIFWRGWMWECKCPSQLTQPTSVCVDLPFLNPDNRKTGEIQICKDEKVVSYK